MILPLNESRRSPIAPGLRRRAPRSDRALLPEDRQTPPTAEQLADRGRFDGIPAVTAAEFFRRLREAGAKVLAGRSPHARGMHWEYV